MCNPGTRDAEGIRETPNGFNDAPDALNGSRGTPYLTKSTITYVLAVMEGCGAYLLLWNKDFVFRCGTGHLGSNLQ